MCEFYATVAVIQLKYCQYGVKHLNKQSINQSVDQSFQIWCTASRPNLENNKSTIQWDMFIVLCVRVVSGWDSQKAGAQELLCLPCTYDTTSLFCCLFVRLFVCLLFFFIHMSMETSPLLLIWLQRQTYTPYPRQSQRTNAQFSAA